MNNRQQNSNPSLVDALDSFQKAFDKNLRNQFLFSVIASTLVSLGLFILILLLNNWGIIKLLPVADQNQQTPISTSTLVVQSQETGQPGDLLPTATPQKPGTPISVSVAAVQELQVVINYPTSVDVNEALFSPIKLLVTVTKNNEPQVGENVSFDDISDPRLGVLNSKSAQADSNGQCGVYFTPDKVDGNVIIKIKVAEIEKIAVIELRRAVSGEVKENNPYMMIDTDGDGLSDIQEAILGSLPNEIDSDKDGVNDGMEVLRFGTGPTVSNIYTPTTTIVFRDASGNALGSLSQSVLLFVINMSGNSAEVFIDIRVPRDAFENGEIKSGSTLLDPKSETVWLVLNSNVSANLYQIIDDTDPGFVRVRLFGFAASTYIKPKSSS